MSRVIVYDTTLRDGMQGEGMSLSVEEKVRVARILDELGVPMIEAGFPTSNPKELELFERLREAGPARRRVRVRDDAAARRAGRGGRGAARARGVLDAGLDDRRQDVGAAPREGRQASTATRTCAMIAESVAFLVAARQARGLRRRALLRRLPRRPGVRDRVPARRAGRGRREPDDVRHQRRVAAARDRRGGPRRAARRCRDAALGIHTHNDAECAVANSLAGDRRGRRAGPGHDERLRRALRQREPDLDHPEPAAEDGLRSACRRWRG